MLFCFPKETCDFYFPVYFIQHGWSDLNAPWDFIFCSYETSHWGVALSHFPILFRSSVLSFASSVGFGYGQVRCAFPIYFWEEVDHNAQKKSVLNEDIYAYIYINGEDLIQARKSGWKSVPFSLLQRSARERRGMG